MKYTKYFSKYYVKNTTGNIQPFSIRLENTHSMDLIYNIIYNIYVNFAQRRTFKRKHISYNRPLRHPFINFHSCHIWARVLI